MVWNCLIVVLIVVVPLAAYLKKALNLTASIIAALMIAVSLSAAAHYAFFIITAFLLISVLDKICHSRLQAANNDITQKSGTRDSIQVLVNGGISMICVLLWHLTNNDCFLLCFASSLIESFGDSAASNIGIAAKQQAYDICRFKKITTGLSGGVSLVGTLGCFASCTLMSIIAYALRVAKTPFEMCILVITSFLGCILDSVIGSLFQRKNKCLVCGKITEKNTHCNKGTIFYSGVKWINNDVVNLLCNAFSAATALLLIG